jgi:hypothetical protein
MATRSLGPVTAPALATLTFRGLEFCDQCGTRLDPGDRLAGMCPACLGPNGTEPMAKPGLKNPRER